jgi:hypothetical protein
MASEGSEKYSSNHPALNQWNLQEEPFPQQVQPVHPLFGMQRRPGEKASSYETVLQLIETCDCEQMKHIF